MNNERDDREATDEALRVIYRGMSSERTPEKLDQLVLREASRAVRSPYLAPLRWSRPLAWVTVIVVSFAIVLQVTDLPRPETGDPHLPEAVERADDDAGLAREDPAWRPAAGAAGSAPVEARQETIVRSAAEAPVPGPAAEPAGQADSASPAAERAASRASVQSAAAGRAPLQQAAGLAERSEQQPPALDCDAAERADPEAWYACIERLRESGLDAAADEQLEALVEAFPEFEPPR